MGNHIGPDTQPDGPGGSEGERPAQVMSTSRSARANSAHAVANMAPYAQIARVGGRLEPQTPQYARLHRAARRTGPLAAAFAVAQDTHPAVTIIAHHPFGPASATQLFSLWFAALAVHQVNRWRPSHAENERKQHV